MKSMLDKEAISKSVDRMSQLKEKITELKSEYDNAEAELLKQFSEDIENTKLKTIRYEGVNAVVDATMADKVTVTYPTVLKKIFGDVYKDLVTEKTTYELTAPAKRMLAAIYNREIVRDMSFEQAIDSLPCSEKAKRTLMIKIKGAKFETDKKNLIKIGEIDAENADTYAYFFSEIINWEQFTRLLSVSGIKSEYEIEAAMRTIDGAVLAEKTPKITLS